MNERIEQLKKQAFDAVWDLDNDPIGPSTHFQPDGFEQKFAELIVRECMACSTWVGKVNKNAIEPIHTAHAINQRIKKHFGVEE